MNCIIIEDQAPAQRILQKYIADQGTLVLVGTFNNAIQALEFVQANTVDLIFLDVHLPKISGMDFLKILPNRPSVILTTAFQDYAVESYEFGVVDYLVKPFSFDRFLKAVAKVSREKSSSTNSSREKEVDTFFFVKSGYEHVKVNSLDVLYINSDMDYTEVHLPDRKLLTSEKLTYWEQKLSGQGFVRIHRSYLINQNKIDKVVGNEVFLNGGACLPIGRAYKDEFLTKILG